MVINNQIRTSNMGIPSANIFNNNNLNDTNIKMISAIAKTIGNYRFFKNEIDFRKILNEKLKFS